MKQLLFLITILSISFSSLSQEDLNIMTFNIRVNLASDSLNAWPYRKDKVSSQVLFHRAHIVGVQEASAGQMTDMQQALTCYRYAGEGRDGGNKGELSAIFYDTVRLKLLKTETFWLSPSPNSVGEKGWDAAYPRNVTWAHFRDRKTKKYFYVFNTHFDHRGIVARRESAKLLMEKVHTIAGSSPVIITGDFNAQPTDEPIMILMDQSNPNRFTDAKSVSARPHYGPTGTFNAFQSKETSNQPIDYIFIKNKVQVLQHATLSQTWEGRFSSDHFPVFARVLIK